MERFETQCVVSPESESSDVHKQQLNYSSVEQFLMYIWPTKLINK